MSLYDASESELTASSPFVGNTDTLASLAVSSAATAATVEAFPLTRMTEAVSAKIEGDLVTFALANAVASAGLHSRSLAAMASSSASLVALVVVSAATAVVAVADVLVTTASPNIVNEAAAWVIGT